MNIDFFQDSTEKSIATLIYFLNEQSLMDKEPGAIKLSLILFDFIAIMRKNISKLEIKKIALFEFDKLILTSLKEISYA